jgi:hypothetical protein
VKRILMGANAWTVLANNIPARLLPSPTFFAGTPIVREPYLAPDDVWIEHDDGSWERVAGTTKAAEPVRAGG